MKRALYWFTDWLGWIFIELADGAPGEWLNGKLYDLGSWFYGVRP